RRKNCAEICLDSRRHSSGSCNLHGRLQSGWFSDLTLPSAPVAIQTPMGSFTSCLLPVSRRSRPPHQQMNSSTPFEEEGVRGHLHRADGTGDGMVLTHGAGGDCNAPLLLAVAEAFQAASVTVLRCDLPFRLQRPSDRLDPQTRPRTEQALEPRSPPCGAL